MWEIFQRDQVDKLNKDLQKMINIGKMEIIGDLWENRFGLPEWGWDGKRKREGNVGWGGAWGAGVGLGGLQAH